MLSRNLKERLDAEYEYSEAIIKLAMELSFDFKEGGYSFLAGIFRSLIEVKKKDGL